MLERVQKILAQAGIASRRKCEQYISEGRVKVNGKVIKLGDKADASIDKIEVSGTVISIEKKVYIMLNKPKGFVTTVSEQHDMRTVMDLIKVKERVFPVGRLDKDTEGLLLFTNDGDFTNRLTHPSFQVQKEYFVVLNKPLSEGAMEELGKGIVIDGRRVRLSSLETADCEVFLSIHEGRKHIVRLLFEKLGLVVKRLVRIRVGRLELGKLQVGKWRFLTDQEVGLLSKK